MPSQGSRLVSREDTNLQPPHSTLDNLSATTRKRILFFVSEDWYFWSHRRSIAAAAVREGYDVWLATRVDRHDSAIRDMGINLVKLRWFRRKTQNFRDEFRALRELAGIYRRLRPHVLHHVALKPVLFGMIAARFTPGRPRIVNALGGMGSLFSFHHAKPGFVRRLILLSFRILSRKARTIWILQNATDRQLLLDTEVAGRERAVVIPGSGADPHIFKPRPEPPGPPLILFASRLIESKGIKEFLAAARLIKQRGIEARFVIAGASDDDNPHAISDTFLQPWIQGGIVEYWGHVEDMPAAFHRAHIFCLPTYYGEGIPKVLIEAAACGLPAVVSDVPGCLEIIQNGGNGLSVPAQDVAALTRALICLITDDRRRLAMKKQARQIFMARFKDAHIIDASLKVWADC